MMNNKVTRIIANSVGLAAVAALGITVYQLGTSPVKEKTPEEKTENVGESKQDTEEQLSEDARTNHVESENQWISDDGEDLDDTKVTFQKQGMYGETAQNTVDNNESDNTADVDKTDNAVNSQQAEESSVNANMKSQTISEDQADEATDVSASALNLATVNFSEDTLMEWPVNGNVLLDYSMDQTTYFPTLDQYKLSPAIAVGAVEGAPVVAAVNGKGYNIFADDAWFQENMGDFREKYGLRCVLHGFSVPMKVEEKWAFVSRLVKAKAMQDEPSEIMKNIYALVKDKEYFVVTSNADVDCAVDVQEVSLPTVNV